MITLTSLQMKDIIYVEDGYKIGHITDIDVEVSSGKLNALIIATKTKMFGIFGDAEEVIIPWDHVMKIGHDVILVKKPTIYISEDREPMFPTE